MKQQIKELRIKIDGLAQFTKGLKPGIREEHHYNVNSEFTKLEVQIFDNSKEIEKAVDSLYLAKAWLGKVLGELGNENPYGSGYKTKEDIVPTADTKQFRADNESDWVDFPTAWWVNSNHIEKVDWLRQEIHSTIEKVKKAPHGSNLKPFINEDNDNIGEILDYNTYAMKHLSEARFWLGFELQRIKEKE